MSLKGFSDMKQLTLISVSAQQLIGQITPENCQKAKIGTRHSLFSSFDRFQGLLDLTTSSCGLRIVLYT